MLIVLAALSIGREALGGLMDPRPLDAPYPGLLVNLGAGVINALWATRLLRAGAALRSRHWWLMGGTCEPTC